MTYVICTVYNKPLVDDQLVTLGVAVSDITRYYTASVITDAHCGNHTKAASP